MSDGTSITRTVDTDLPVDELWALVADGDGWASWMVDAADVDVAPGAGGTVVDDGVERDVRVDTVGTDHHVGFRWWPTDRPDLVTSVELVVLPASTGSRLRVTETYLRAGASSATTWDVRLMLLVARASARASAFV